MSIWKLLHVGHKNLIIYQNMFTSQSCALTCLAVLWCSHLLTYVVWQKSNETDLLLTMSFILFTNQGYPLQNSSLGQLHSDGGVVSTVRSSARRLLLEYLSARRLRSSGYYPKYQNGALSSGFLAGEIKWNLTHYWSFSKSIDNLTSQEISLFPHCGPFFRLKVFPHEVRLPLLLGLLKRTCDIWTLVPWIGNVLHKPFVTLHKPQ